MLPGTVRATASLPKALVPGIQASGDRLADKDCCLGRRNYHVARVPSAAQARRPPGRVRVHGSVPAGERRYRRPSRVREFMPGGELPSVRESASRYKTTVSTIGRAYRRLADAGVITAADRQRSRVALSGVMSAWRLLGAGGTLRLAGSDDPGLDLVLRHVGQSVLTVGARGSFTWRGRGRKTGVVV